MDEEIKVEESSGNIFLDLGFSEEEAKEELLKSPTRCGDFSNSQTPQADSDKSRDDSRS